MTVKHEKCKIHNTVRWGEKRDQSSCSNSLSKNYTNTNNKNNNNSNEMQACNAISSWHSHFTSDTIYCALTKEQQQQQQLQLKCTPSARMHGDRVQRSGMSLSLRFIAVGVWVLLLPHGLRVCVCVCVLVCAWSVNKSLSTPL